MGNLPGFDPVAVGTARLRPFGSKVISCTGVVVAFGTHRSGIDLARWLIACTVVALAALAISGYAIRRLARPLSQLHADVVAIRDGRLEPIPVSHTRDEIEFLGDAFNQTISALAESREEIRHTGASSRQAKSEFLARIAHSDEWRHRDDRSGARWSTGSGAV